MDFYINYKYDLIKGSIPSSIGNLRNLLKLDFRANHLSGAIPQEIGLLTKLTDLDLSSNNFVGAVPIELSNLTHLSRLKVQGEQLFSVGQPSSHKRPFVRRLR